MLNKKILLLIGLILLTTTFAFSQYIQLDDCLVYDNQTNHLIQPKIINLNNRGVYEYFKPIARPTNYYFYKPSVQISQHTGINIKELRCEWWLH